MSDRLILVVDDDFEIRNLVSELLQKNGYQVITVPSATSAEDALQRHKPAVMLLDIGLPDEDGIQFCKRIQQKKIIPVIMLTASDDDIDRILAYEMGAEQYITKPFAPKLLLAMIKAVTRRHLASKEPLHKRFYKRYALFSGWYFDLQERVLIRKNGTLSALTDREFDVLTMLLEHCGEVLSRDQMIRDVYSRSYSGCDRNIDMIVMRIRKKLEQGSDAPQIIRSVHSVGYLFNTSVIYQDSISFEKVVEE